MSGMGRVTSMIQQMEQLDAEQQHADTGAAPTAAAPSRGTPTASATVASGTPVATPTIDDEQATVTRGSNGRAGASYRL